MAWGRGTGAWLVLVAAVCAAAFGAQKGGENAGKAAAEGMSKYVAGDGDGALVSFSKALELDGGNKEAAWGKAAIFFTRANFRGADEVLQEYMKQVAMDEQAWMLAYVAQARGGYAKRATLTALAGLVDGGTWFGKTLALFSGEIRPEYYVAQARQKVKEAAPKPKPEKVLTELCRELFFAGEAHLIKGDEVKAKRTFEASVDVKTGFSWYREMAKAEVAATSEKAANDAEAGQE